MEHIIQRDDKGHFLPGTTGNPEGLGGRPAGSVSLVTKLKNRLYEHPEEQEAIVNALINMGKSRELGAIQEIINRTDGKVAERHIVEEIPIKLLFVAAGETIALQGQDERPRLAPGEDAGQAEDFETE